MSRTRALPAVALALALASNGCAPAPEDPETWDRVTFALAAYCTANVIGKGNKAVETDYIPHVVQCENGSAPLEALKAQAVAARSYLYYKLNTSGSVADGTSDQVYSCGATPNANQVAAAQQTAGQVLRYQGTQVAAFYVAGAVPTAASCVAKASDNDYSNTEKYVTYNWNKSGSGIKQTSLGWVNAGNKANRGCKSQNGAKCLAQKGWGYKDILKFYYGMDIELVTAEGSCVGGSCDCSPGQTQSQACGNCGQRTRTCQSDCKWGGWSACNSQGACAAGAGQEQACGNCGQKSRTCQANCTWGSWSGCAGEGACAPGAQQEEACCDCGSRTRKCSGQCQWGGWGGCAGPDPAGSPVCDTGLLGQCGIGARRCVAGCLGCEQTHSPSEELCDGLDNDCDGMVDEGATAMGDTAPALAARLVDVSAPGALAAGETARVWARFENAGTAGWPAGATWLQAEAQGAQPASPLWVPGSWSAWDAPVAVQEAVAPGESVTLEFDVRMPADPTDGTSTRFTLVVDGTIVPCPSPGFELSPTGLAAGPGVAAAAEGAGSDAGAAGRAVDAARGGGWPGGSALPGAGSPGANPLVGGDGGGCAPTSRSGPGGPAVLLLLLSLAVLRRTRQPGRACPS